MTCLFSNLAINDNKVVLSDFNLKPANPTLLNFPSSQNFINLIEGNTFSKGKDSCWNLILTNRKYSFRNTYFLRNIIIWFIQWWKQLFVLKSQKTKNRDIIFQFPVDLVTFTEEILNRNLYFSCSIDSRNSKWDYLEFHVHFVEILNKLVLKKAKIFWGKHNTILTKQFARL